MRSWKVGIFAASLALTQVALTQTVYNSATNQPIAGATVQLIDVTGAGNGGSLFIQKTANKTTAELGDFVDYTIKLNNVSALPLPATVVNDSLGLAMPAVQRS